MSLRVGNATVAIEAVEADGPAPFQAQPPKIAVESALVITRVGNSRIVTHHPIQPVHGSDRFEILAGKPVDKTSALALLESIRDAGETADGWIHPSVLFKSDRAIAWHVPESMRGLYYKHAKAHSMRVPWPALVFVARRDGALQLFAVAGNERPGPKTRLYHAPIANVDAGGFMCWGTADKPQFGLSGIPAYEAAVFHTWFTHPNHRRALAGARSWEVGAKDDYIFDFYRRLSASKAKRFPAKALVKTNLTLEKVCAD